MNDARFDRWALPALGVALFALSLIFVWKFSGVPNSDGAAYYEYTRSLFLHHTFSVTNPQVCRYDLIVNPSNGYGGWVFPVGGSILLLPFFALAHLHLLIATALGLSNLPLDGYNSVYYTWMSVGVALYGVGATLISLQILRRYFSLTVSIVAVTLCYTCSNMFFYSVNGQVFVHSIAAFSAALYIWKALSMRKQQTTPHIFDFMQLGIAGGIMILVRTENAVLMVYPALPYLWDFLRKPSSRKFLILGMGAMMVLCFITMIPQLLAWNMLYGTYFLRRDDVFWLDPYFVGLLFSSRNGLAPWAPVFFFSLLGMIPLLGKKDRELWFMFLAFLALLYVHAAVVDWYAGLSFGARRQLVSFFFYSLGLAACLEKIWLWRRWLGYAVATLAALALFLWQQELGKHVPLSGYSAHMYNIYLEASRQVTTQAWDATYKNIGNPFSFPFPLLTKHQYDIAPGRFDDLVAETSPNIDFSEPYNRRLLLNGFRRHPELYSKIYPAYTSEFDARDASVLLYFSRAQRFQFKESQLNTLEIRISCHACQVPMPLQIQVEGKTSSKGFILQPGSNVLRLPLVLQPNDTAQSILHFSFDSGSEQVRERDLVLEKVQLVHDSVSGNSIGRSGNVMLPH